MSTFFVLAATLLALLFVSRKLYYKRFQEYAKLPQLPTSLLFGHLKIYNELMKNGPLDRDYDEIFYEIYQRLDRPRVFFLDYRPICRPAIFIACHEIAEQISRATELFPTSVPKVDLTYLESVIGSTSILSSHGEEWKLLRKKFNHGFSLQHLMTLIPTMAAKTMVLVRNLDTLSQYENEFSLVSLARNLTFDIIGSGIMDIDLKAQHIDPSQRGELIRSFTELLDAYWDDKIHIPWWLKIRTVLRRRRLGKRVEEILKSIIKRKYEEQQANLRGKNDNHKRSILSLSFQDTTNLSQSLLNLTCDQLRTFLLAGHDTPSATIAWIFYEFSRNPRVLSAVYSELDDIFGPHKNPESICAQLVSPAGPDLVGRMSYVLAVIKETLRLHTPASTARYSAPGTGFAIRMPGGERLCVDDLIIYNCNSIIHRDPTVYGHSADYFMPERWLGGIKDMSNGDQNHSATRIPHGAWRPFERGPRGCIGQEFATIEMRVIIAMIARQYEFTKVHLGELALNEDCHPIPDNDGRYKVKSNLYNTRQITARPADGMMMTVKKIGITGTSLQKSE